MAIWKNGMCRGSAIGRRRPIGVYDMVSRLNLSAAQRMAYIDRNYRGIYRREDFGYIVEVLSYIYCGSSAQRTACRGPRKDPRKKKPHI